MFVFLCLSYRGMKRFVLNFKGSQFSASLGKFTGSFCGKGRIMSVLQSITFVGLVDQILRFSQGEWNVFLPDDVILLASPD